MIVANELSSDDAQYCLLTVLCDGVITQQQLLANMLINVVT